MSAAEAKTGRLPPASDANGPDVARIALPRAVGLHIRNSLRGIVNASDDDCGEEKCRDCAPVRVMRTALAALDAALSEPKETFAESLFRRSWEAHRAALAEPDAKREPVAWIVTDKDGKVRKFLTAPLGFGVSELVRFDGDTMSPLYAGDTVTLDYIKEDKP